MLTIQGNYYSLSSVENQINKHKDEATDILIIATENLTWDIVNFVAPSVNVAVEALNIYVKY